MEEKARNAAIELRSILSVPHKPFSCEESAIVSASPERQCPTIKLTSERCTLMASAGQRLCMMHAVTHASISVIVRAMWKTMEVSRTDVARIGNGQGSVDNAKTVKGYICKVNDVVEELQRHQETYSCRGE